MAAAFVAIQGSRPQRSGSLALADLESAVEIVFDGPVQISANGVIEQPELEDVDIDQLRRIQLFERNGKVRSVIGIKGDACARLGSVQWGAKSKKDNARVVLDVERFD